MLKRLLKASLGWLPCIFLAGCFGFGGKSGGGGSSPSVSSLIMTPNIVSAGASATTYQTSEYNAQAGLGLMKVAQAYANIEMYRGSSFVGGPGVKVVVAGNGADYSNPELLGQYLDYRGDIGGVVSNVSSNASIEGEYNPIAGNNDGANIRQHEVMVSSVISAIKGNSGGVNNFHGVAYNSKIIPYKIIHNNGDSVNLNVLSSMINYADLKGARIVNGSFVLSSTNTDPNVLAIIKTKDIAAVFSSGNDSLSNAYAPGSLGSSVNTGVGRVVAVAATNASGNLASYSNKCGNAKAWCLAAFGGESGGALVSASYYSATSGSYVYGSVLGTSFSAPMVSGGYALLLGAWPQLSVAQATEILLRTADPRYDDALDSGIVRRADYEVDSAKTSNVYGWGVMNLERATKPVGQLNYVTSSGYTFPVEATAFNTGGYLSAVASSTALNGTVASDAYNRQFISSLSNKVSVGGDLMNPGSIFLLSGLATSGGGLSFNSNKEVSSSFSGGTMSFAVSSRGNKETNSLFLQKHNNNFVVDEYNLTAIGAINPVRGFNFSRNFESSNGETLGFNVTMAGHLKSIDNNIFSEFEQMSLSSLTNINGESFVSNPYFAMLGNFASGASAKWSGKSGFFVSSQIASSENYMNKNSGLNVNQFSGFVGISNLLLHNRSQKTGGFSAIGYAGNGGSLSVGFGVMQEKSGLLNSYGTGAMSLQSSDVHFIELKANKAFSGGLNGFVSITEGRSSGNQGGGIISAISPVAMRKFSVGILKNNVLGGKILLAYSEPNRVINGRASIVAPIDISSSGQYVYQEYNLSLKTARTRVFESAWVKKLSETFSLKMNFMHYLNSSYRSKMNSIIFSTIGFNI